MTSINILLDPESVVPIEILGSEDPMLLSSRVAFIHKRAVLGLMARSRFARYQRR